MRAPLEICSGRRIVAGLASGVVISLTALTGGLAPAVADPDTDPIAPTTVPAPEPEVTVPAETGAPETPETAAPPTEAVPPPPDIESRPPTQAPESPPAIEQPTTHTVVTPQQPESPTAVQTPSVTADEPPAPQDMAPSSIEQLPETPTARTSASEATDPTSTPDVTSTSPPTAAVGATARSQEPVVPSSEISRDPAANGRPATPSSESATPEADPEAGLQDLSGATEPSTISHVAQLVEPVSPKRCRLPSRTSNSPGTRNPLS